MRLENKVAIVTGGAKGLGGAMAQLFAAEGAKVIAVDMADGLSYECENVEFYKLNVTDGAACKAFADYAIEKYGKIDILINNAGITRDALTRKMTDEQWDLVVDVDLKGVFNLTRHIGPHMEETGGGSIVSISSVVGEFGNIGQANYAAAKAGVIGLTQAVAKEAGPSGIRVNCIAPGIIETGMNDHLSPEEKTDLLNEIPLEGKKKAVKEYWQVTALKAVPGSASQAASTCPVSFRDRRDLLLL